VARQQFCPLQRFEFVSFFRGDRPKRGVWHRKRRKIAPSDGLRVVPAFAAAGAAIELAPPAPFNLTTTARARYRRITSWGSLRTIAIESRLDYFHHVQFPFAGAVQQTPAGIFCGNLVEGARHAAVAD
jgi:hypothetical protein